MPPRQPQPLDPQHVVALRSQLADTFAQLFARAGYVELAKLGVIDPPAVFDAKRPDIQERALKLADDTLGRIARTAGDRVRKTISEELGKGKDQFQIADALREAFAGMSQRQARTVMRTVTRDLYNGASLDSYEAVGITHAIAHDGFGGLSGKTDADCVAPNGQRFTIAQAREQEHSPITHPNCTLHWTPDVSTLPADGPLPGLGLSMLLDFNPEELRDFHGRWRDRFGLVDPGVPIPGLHGLKPVFDLKERDLPLDDRAEFQSQKLSESFTQNIDALVVKDPLEGGAISTAARSAAKRDLCRHLQARLVNDPRWNERAIHATPGQAIGALVDAWATTSGDHDVQSLAIQVAAARELLGEDIRPDQLFGNDHGATGADMEYIANQVTRRLAEPGVEDSMRAFVRAQYEATQIWLAQRGIKRVQLARGMRLQDNPFSEEHGQTEITMNPLSSWTLDLRTAMGFGVVSHGRSTVLLAEVPAERVFAIPRTGVGCLPEWEVVLLGTPKGEHDTVLQWNTDEPSPGISEEGLLRLWGLV